MPRGRGVKDSWSRKNPEGKVVDPSSKDRSGGGNTSPFDLPASKVPLSHWVGSFVMEWAAGGLELANGGCSSWYSSCWIL